jgi:hypothetical protein
LAIRPKDGIILSPAFWIELSDMVEIDWKITGVDDPPISAEIA